MVCNESVREQISQEKLELSVQERRLRLLEHVRRMSDEKIAKQVLYWAPEDRRRRGQPRITWQHMINRDIEKGGLSWKEAMSLTADGRDWRNCII